MNRHLPLLALAALALAPVLAESPAPPLAATAPAEDAHAVALDIIALMGDINAIAASKQPKAGKLAALHALKPRAAALGKRSLAVGLAKVQALVDGEMKTEFRRNTSAFDALFRDFALGSAFSELDALLRDSYDPATSVEEMADIVLGVLREGVQVLENSELTPEDRNALLDEAMLRLGRFVPWLKEGGDCAAVAALLHESAEFRDLARRYQEQTEKDKKSVSASWYCEELSMLLYDFYSKHQDNDDSLLPTALPLLPNED